MLVELTWVLAAAVLTSMILAISLGANDVGNFFGTSVGAKVLSIKKAFLLAIVSEILGSVLLGEKVSDTIWKKIIDYNDFRNREKFVMVGNLSAMIGCCIWLIIATKLKMPVSATHSIVGGTIGYAMVAHGTKGVNWLVFIKILFSWFFSPLLAGLLSVSLLLIIRKFLSSVKEPVMIVIKWLPFIYGFTVTINVFSIFISGPDTHLHFWQQALITSSLGVFVSLLVWYFTVPRVTNSIRKVLIPYAGGLEHDDNDDSSNLSALLETIGDEDSVRTKVYRYIKSETGDYSQQQLMKNYHSRYRSVRTDVYIVSDDNLPYVHTSCEADFNYVCGFGDRRSSNKGCRSRSPSRELAKRRSGEIHLLRQPTILDRADVAKIFALLQVMSAIFGSFTHGCNDVSNAIAPLVAIWMIWVTEVNLMGAKTPLWILMHGGLCIGIGIWFFGEGTTITIGEGITQVTPTSGFVMELCSAIAVLIASNLGLPVSSTHCKVGSVVCVGSLNGAKAVDWKLVRNIALAWTVTFPATAITSAGVMTLLIRIVPNLD